MKTLALILFAGGLIALGTGCASFNSVGQMPAAVDATAKSLQPPAGKSLVYVVRPTLLGKPFGGTITANDVYIGTTQGGIYVYAILAPDTYKFKVTGHDNDSDISVKLEPDKIYYIKESVFPGLFKGFTSLALLGDDEGRKTLQDCALSDKLGENIAH